MAIPSKLLLSDLLKHNVLSENGVQHGPIVRSWMHPPTHRILGFISRPSNLKLQRDVWRLDQLKAIDQQQVYVKGNFSISDEQTLERFPTFINACIFNKAGQKLGLIADFLFEPKLGHIKYYLISRSNPLIPGTSRWRLSISKIIDKQPGSISCDIDTLEDLPIYKASLREEFLSQSRKWKIQLQDMSYKASDRLEGWIDDQISEKDNDTFHDEYIPSDNFDSYDDWIDNIDSSQEFNTMDKVKRKTKSFNENDHDPWI